ncbi:MAG TPA: isochorismatase family cysteine hydrolase [Spirochaetota bacterium]|nr:isochorismatase family cysteine hydrolase [Spirochaetota bacterium]HPS86346.1 isochorismatase family cysteine hydrolase [Spirochaetota bacterium]
MKGFALIIVDMQKYYLESDSVYSGYFNFLYPGSLSYIRDRSYNIAIPNIIKMKKSFKILKLPVIYLRLCGHDLERRDLHRFFKKSYEDGLARGFDGVYPIDTDPAADIIDELKPDSDDTIVNKTTFSPFSSSDIDSVLKSLNITTLVFTGLATSQCVETTARDASDRGYEVFQIHDAQADYDEVVHEASLYSSRGVCGGAIYDTESFLELILEFT